MFEGFTCYCLHFFNDYVKLTSNGDLFTVKTCVSYDIYGQKFRDMWLLVTVSIKNLKIHMA